MSIQFHINKSDQESLHLSVAGQLTTTTATEFEVFLKKNITSSVKTVVLELHELSFIASAGLRVFAKMRKLMRSRNGNLYFLKLSPQVKKVFSIAKAVPLNEVFVNEAELDLYLDKIQSQI